MFRTVRRLASLTSPGVWVIVTIAVCSSIAVATWPTRDGAATKFWTFASQHEPIYREVLAEWNRANPAHPVELQVLSIPVMEQRMMSGFLSQTPLADLMEVERSIAGRAFTGPIDQVGFIDLTDLIEKEGLLEKVNAPFVYAVDVPRPHLRPAARRASRDAGLSRGHRGGRRHRREPGGNMG